MKRSSSALAAMVMITLGGIGMTAAQMLSPIVPQAQAAYCQNRSFTAQIKFSPTRVRSQPNTQSPVTKQFQAGAVVQFSTFVYGETIADAWTGQPDNMWFKLADGSGYIASAVIAGYPPDCGTVVEASNSILAHAKTWVDRRVPYNQGAYYQGYRQDCSGFVSMAWQLPVSAVTSTLPQFSRTLSSRDELQAGDAINNRKIGNEGHVVLFVQWKDKNQGKFIAYEENGSLGTAQTELTLEWKNNGWNIKEYGRAPWYLERKR
ncbi:hypothetical protein ACQ4M3_34250 [Leptolyngbya sp. AN03gr2]|uniref:hypothetical protein n=1 Tax=unclassified Leptolyngbya TaxID=2650499 RepID=UPI003D31EB1E